MKIKTKQYALALFDVYQDSSNLKKDDILVNFVNILKANNDIHLMDRIIADFTDIWDKNKNIVRAEISSAHDLDVNTKEILVNKIKELSGASELDLKNSLNTKLIGGVVVKYGDKILDSSILSRLKSLQEEFSA